MIADSGGRARHFAGDIDRKLKKCAAVTQAGISGQWHGMGGYSDIHTIDNHTGNLCLESPPGDGALHSSKRSHFDHVKLDCTLYL